MTKGNRMLGARIAVSALVMAVAGQASAASYRFSAEFFSASPVLSALGMTSGTTLSGRLVYDETTAPEPSGDPLSALYLGALSSSVFEIRDGGATIFTGSAGTGNISVSNGSTVPPASGNDAIAFAGAQFSGEFGGLDLSLCDLILTDTGATALADVLLPAVLPPLGEFEIPVVILLFDQNAERAEYRLTSLDRCVDDADCDDVPEVSDNCPALFNPLQADLDVDGAGDLCDPCPNDATDTCDPDRSGSATLGAGGGSLTTPDGSVRIDVPPGALSEDSTISITDSGNGTAFELSTDLGEGTALFQVNLAPEDLTFQVPVTVCFFWPDEAPEDGTIDGTNMMEPSVLVTRDNVDVTGRCSQEPGPLATTGAECDPVGNSFCFLVSAFSDWTLFQASAQIDIRPGSDFNPIQPRSHGLIPVAILGSAGFDVAEVDVTTLAFGPDGATPAHAAGGHLDDVNADGFTDLVSHYRNEETGIISGDTACLTGETLDGVHFRACDTVLVLGACGIGFELALLLPGLLWLRAWRRKLAR